MYYVLREGVAYWRLTHITAKMSCVMPLWCFERRNESHTYDCEVYFTSNCYWITSFIQSSSCLEIFLINKIELNRYSNTTTTLSDCLIESGNFKWNNKWKEIFCFIIWKFWYIALPSFIFLFLPFFLPSLASCMHNKFTLYFCMFQSMFGK